MADLKQLAKLPCKRVIAEYVWIDGSDSLRGKARVLEPEAILTPEKLPQWNYDGSSTNQAPGDNSEVILRPQAVYPDPFRGAPHILVMCDTVDPSGKPLPTNKRAACAQVMSEAAAHKPWFGLEQEYFIMNPATGRPLGWAATEDPPAQGPYYCGVGGDKMGGRDIVDAHMKACIYAGIKISGINAEVAPGQWEYQVGPAEGIEQGDSLWMSRYLLSRCAEMRGLEINYDPKPISGDWNGTGCHANFSTELMRAASGYEKHIVPAIEKLAAKHHHHIELYGAGNEKRLTGSHETASIDTFKWGVADRGASVRVGNDVVEKGCGYFEDRRPAGNCDPYVVTRLLVETCVLE